MVIVENYLYLLIILYSAFFYFVFYYGMVPIINDLYYISLFYLPTILLPLSYSKSTFFFRLLCILITVLPTILVLFILKKDSYTVVNQKSVDNIEEVLSKICSDCGISLENVRIEPKTDKMLTVNFKNVNRRKQKDFIKIVTKEFRVKFRNVKKGNLFFACIVISIIMFIATNLPNVLDNL